MIITFLGHSTLSNDEGLREKIKRAIEKNIREGEKTVFYCGGYGDFDTVCSSVCRSLRKEWDCELDIALVTPYITEGQQKKLKYLMYNGLYDSIIYPPIEKVPPRFAIVKRNEWMIDKSELVIAYVEREYGGAYRGLQYALRKKKRIENLARPALGDE